MRKIANLICLCAIFFGIGYYFGRESMKDDIREALRKAFGGIATTSEQPLISEEWRDGKLIRRSGPVQQSEPELYSEEWRDGKLIRRTGTPP